jgi:hypothetical protein
MRQRPPATRITSPATLISWAEHVADLASGLLGYLLGRLPTSPCDGAGESIRGQRLALGIVRER